MVTRLLPILATALALLSPSLLFSQDGMQSAPKNYTGFSSERRSVDEEVLLYNQGFENHPELGMLYTEAPCDDCFELIGKRTPTSKLFVKRGSAGTYVYQQSSTDAMHFQSPSGEERTVIGKLRPQGAGIFSADLQPIPAGINTNNGGMTYLGTAGQRFYFHRNLTLVYEDAGGYETLIGPASWQNYTAGDDGVYITDAWPGIDVELIVLRGSIKSNYIIKNPMPQYAAGKLKIRDHFMMEGGVHISNRRASYNQQDVEVSDAAGNILYRMAPGFVYDEKSRETDTYAALTYALNGNALDIIIPDEWLNRTDAAAYPVTVDPLFQGTNSMTIAGSGYNATCFAGGCAYNLAVPVPAAITVTDIRWSFNYMTNGFLCWTSDGAVDFTLGTCRSPNAAGFYWFCNGVGGGTCTGANISIFSHVQGCIPAPQCAAYNMNFTMRFYRCYGAGAGCTNTCIAAASPLTMVVEGRTVEPTGLVTTLPAATICQGQSTTLTATGQNGVAAYNYTWNPGALAGNPSVSPAATTTYTVTITDACGNTTTATKLVTVVPSANPGFTMTPNPACVGQTITFTGLGSGAAADYDWTAAGSSNPAVNNSQSFTATYPAGGNFPVTLNFTNGTCVFPVTQNITINPTSAPSVTVTANPAGPICAGTNVTFTATATNGGTTPSYQWQVGGVNTGTNSSTFSSNTLTNGQSVTCIVTSNSPCAVPPTATSTAIVMQVNPVVIPTITITANPSGPVCAGTPITYTATITNGGTTPVYQWMVNGVNTGTNSNTFTTSTLTNGQTVTCQLTSNAPCAAPVNVVSAGIAAQITPPVTPTITIAANPSGPVCSGTNITFTATITNGGTTPSYQWQINGFNAGTNSNTFTVPAVLTGQSITCTLTSNANCATPASVTSAPIVLTVTPTVVPSVTITANPNGPICAGTNVTFTATATNGGTTPSYQWQVGGVNAGTNSNTFSSTTLTNGQSVTCTVTSNAPCASPTTATSAPIVMQVNPVVIPTITITANPSGAVCAGTPVTYTATITNGGPAPVYQWMVGGVNVGTNSNTFTSAGIMNGQNVTCQLTSNAPCASPVNVVSAGIVAQVTPLVVPTITITPNPAGSICSGTNVTFTATITNGGTTPSYQWQVGGVNAGTNSPTFSTSTLANGQSVTCILTSNAACATPVSVTSAPVVMQVTPSVTPSVTIAANPTGPICAGVNVTFTATPVNGGTTPVYQWQVNGVNAGTNSSTFSSATLANGDAVTVIMTSNALCASPGTVTSAAINMQVTPVTAPTATITSNPAMPLCNGASPVFTAAITNGGTAPAYQWQVNGVNAGTNQNTFSPGTLAAGDIVTVILTSNGACVNPLTATSNGITVSYFAPLAITMGPAVSACYGSSVTLGATPSGGNAASYTIAWSPAGPNITATAGTTYTATVTDACGTTVPGTVNLTVFPQPVAGFTYLPAEPSLSNQPMVFTDISTGATAWQWMFGDGNTSVFQNPSNDYDNTGSYAIQLIVTSADNCKDTAIAFIIVDEQTAFYIPSAFTPNGDKLNDYFVPVGLGVVDYTLDIFNRWGQLVYTTGSGSGLGWNGYMDANTIAPMGVYTYRIYVEFLDKVKEVYHGKVNLIR